MRKTENINGIEITYYYTDDADDAPLVFPPQQWKFRDTTRLPYDLTLTRIELTELPPTPQATTNCFSGTAIYRGNHIIVTCHINVSYDPTERTQSWDFLIPHARQAFASIELNADGQTITRYQFTPAFIAREQQIQEDARRRAAAQAAAEAEEARRAASEQARRAQLVQRYQTGMKLVGNIHIELNGMRAQVTFPDNTVVRIANVGTDRNDLFSLIRKIGLGKADTRTLGYNTNSSKTDIYNVSFSPSGKADRYTVALIDQIQLDLRQNKTRFLYPVQIPGHYFLLYGIRNDREVTFCRIDSISPSRKTPQLEPLITALQQTLTNFTFKG